MGEQVILLIEDGAQADIVSPVRRPLVPSGPVSPRSCRTSASWRRSARRTANYAGRNRARPTNICSEAAASYDERTQRSGAFFLGTTRPPRSCLGQAKAAFAV